jgi:hypothetical protein
MRFTLTTLILLTLLLAALMAVWFRREPWTRDPRSFSRDDIEALYPKHAFRTVLIDPKVAPDGRFISMENQGDSRIYIVLKSGQRHLLYDFWTEQLLVREFIDNDTLLTNSIYSEAPTPYLLFHRRYPEEWWGHLYRPEVWATLLLSLTLAVRFVRARRRSILSDSTHPAISSIGS